MHHAPRVAGAAAPDPPATAPDRGFLKRQSRRQAEADRPIGRPDAPEEQRDAGDAEHDVRQPTARVRPESTPAGPLPAPMYSTCSRRRRRRCPSTKLASLPSFRLVAPSARPISASTKHAAGSENFC